MTNRILFRAYANENTISVQTYTPRMKSPQRFYITYSELGRLRDEGSLITSDIHSFVRLRLDERRDRITFEFTWLSGRSFDRVEGVEQTVNLRWSQFRDFLDAARQPDCPEDDKIFRAISLDVRAGRPRLVFDGNRANLRAAIENPLIRHKLGKALIQDADTFLWFSTLADIYSPVFSGFDVMDSRWDTLAGSLNPKQYRPLFEACLDDGMAQEEIQSRLDRYQELTGSSYVDLYWEHSHGDRFGLLVNKGILDLWSLFRNSLCEDSQIDKPEMVANIWGYVRGIHTPQAYRFFEQFFSTYGVEGLERFFSYHHRNFPDALTKQSFSSIICCALKTTMRSSLKSHPKVVCGSTSLSTPRCFWGKRSARDTLRRSAR